MSPKNNQLNTFSHTRKLSEVMQPAFHTLQLLFNAHKNILETSPSFRAGF